MKIVFLGLASSFTPGMTYQDNMLCNQALKDGHRVVYISNPEKFDAGVLIDTTEEDTILDNGLRLIRLPYLKIGTKHIYKKLRIFRGISEILDKETPDIIFCHNMQYMPLIDVIEYKKKHCDIKVYADIHTTKYNSASNWVSLEILHKIYYKLIIKSSLPYIDKILYIGEDERIFAENIYGIPKSRMEHCPLGGYVPCKDEYDERRRKKRSELGLSSSMRMYLHSGKLTKKKKTIELIKAYSSVPDDNSRLIIIGNISEDILDEVNELINNDNRIIFDGWKCEDEIMDYLCATDLYCQPGSVSATMQNAICCTCAIMAYPHLSYTKWLDWGNIIWVKDVDDMRKAFLSILGEPDILKVYADRSRVCAEKVLDYKIQARKLFLMHEKR